MHVSLLVGRLSVAALSAIAATTPWAQSDNSVASTYPNPSRTIRIVDAFPPGGSTDYLARQIANRIGADWKASLIVENRAGAAGQVGTGWVARSEADGYNVLVIPNELWTVAPVLYGKRLPYDTHKQLMQLAPVAEVPIVVTVNPSLPVSNIKELVAYAAQKPGQASYGSAGVGSIHQLTAELFASKAGVSLLHVPYQGTAPAINGLLGGQVTAVFSPISSVLPHIKAGKLKALAVTGGARAQALPNVPTVAEAGVPDYQATFRVSLLAPRGIPELVRKKWFDEVRKVMDSAEVRNAIAVQGIEPDLIDHGAWLERFAQEGRQWQSVIDKAQLRVE
ncbi:Bug family tripartite tricarboxylate transporter substrate binding protein [Hydrogenophaga sp. BPS33]|uniref:Bug family tripartite tricarboxylate transporter substrate binding protein n=1 Tax=Hydrogenophaga sp. BPS33 TaxID=2651974 RepID=UPI00131FAB44|nr:tripartite tricarboxylate transporter substrate-binding protein [Hydrogenophaga sp. BPS33]QHE86402.1 tripartite tricarboxylate transporter substrate binding protein [Hydrogenophaga sp. BPS33]